MHTLSFKKFQTKISYIFFRKIQFLLWIPIMAQVPDQYMTKRFGPGTGPVQDQAVRSGPRTRPDQDQKIEKVRTNSDQD